MKLIPACAFLPIALAGCIPSAENAETGPTAPEPTGSCDSSKLDYAAGKKLTPELEARLKSEAKAALVRVAPHDGMITMDYSAARLNIFIDETRTIIRINCG